jgi:hypothetical protein
MQLSFATTVLAVSFALATSDAKASSDGNKLLQQCKQVVRLSENDWNGIDVLDSSACMGQMKGILDMNSIYRVMLMDKGALFCPPAEVTVGQSIRVVTKYLEDHPEELHEDSTVLIVKVLHKTFSCSPSGR